jgi:hypothetical protein
MMKLPIALDASTKLRGALVCVVSDVTRGVYRIAADALRRENYATAGQIVEAMSRRYSDAVEDLREEYAEVVATNEWLAALLADELRKTPSP